MKHLPVLLIATLVTGFSTFGQKTKNQMRMVYYENAKRDTSCSNPDLLLFFKSFPSSFRELDMTYGWDNEKGTRRELYDVGVEHLELFKKTYDCFPREWTLKSVKIALNGKWDADAITYFKVGLEEKIVKNPTLYFFYLSQFTTKENISFWKFIIDGPHKPEPTILKFKKVTDKNSLQSKYFKAAVRLKWGK